MIEAKTKHVYMWAACIVGVLFCVAGLVDLGVTGWMCLFADKCVALEKTYFIALWFLSAVVFFFLGTRIKFPSDD